MARLNGKGVSHWIPICTEVHCTRPPRNAHYTRAPIYALNTFCVNPPPRAALDGKRPQRGPQKRLGRRLEEVAKAVGGGYCRLQMPLRLAHAVREAVAGHRAPWSGGGGIPPPPFQCIPAPSAHALKAPQGHDFQDPLLPDDAVVFEHFVGQDH